MNLTKQNRDHLGPINTNIGYANEPISHSKDKDQVRNRSQSKKESQMQLTNLYSMIDTLKYENQSMNAIVRTKNQQIHNLKSQLKSQAAQNFTQEKQNIKQVYYVNSFKSNNLDNNTISTELDRANYQIRVLTKQRDELKKYIEQLQQQPQKLVNANNQGYGIVSKSVNVPMGNQAILAQQQHQKVIDQYEQHIAAMAGKLSTVHKLQLEIAALNQDKNLILQDFQGMRNELVNRIGYCEHLQNQIKRLEQQKYQPANNKIIEEIQHLSNNTHKLEQQVSKLKKQIKQKDDKISEMTVKSGGYVQVTKQAFQSMQTNISNLQQKIAASTDAQRKQAQKATNLQVQLNKLNRQLSEKSKKAEAQIQNARKLQQQKVQLTNNLTKLKSQLKQMERKYQDKAYEFTKIQAELEKKNNQQKLIKDCSIELEMQKKKLKQSQDLVRKLLQKLQKIELNYNQIRKDNNKSVDLAKECKNTSQKYDKVIKDQNDLIGKLNERNKQRLDELQLNIQKNLNLQQRLREFSNRYDPLADEIEQYIQQNFYVKTPQS